MSSSPPNLPAPPDRHLPPPAPPREPSGRSRHIGSIAAIAVGLAVLIAIGLFIGSRRGHATASSSPTVSASPSSAGAGPAGPTDTPHTFPSTLGGEPRLTGAAADAYQSFIQKISRGDVGEVAVYGARDDPAYIVAEIGDSFVTSDAQATRLLNLTAGAAKITLTGPTEHDVGRDVHTACRATEGLTIRFLCVIDDGDRVVMIFATAEAPGNDHVAIARDTVA